MKSLFVFFPLGLGRVFTDGFTISRLNSVLILFLSLGIALLLPLKASWAETEYKEAVPVAENPEIEQRMLTLTEDLRCLVCQNESIAESRADFSNDIRRIIREQIKANKTDEEIIDFLVDRYGDFVLYNPPMKNTTVLLWFGPLIFFLFSSWFLVKYLKGRRREIKEVTLSDVELKRAAHLLDDDSYKRTEDHLNKNTKLDNQDHSSTLEQHQKADVSTSENKGNNV
ncbi:cytochrome c-type biogenesis protein [Nitrosomonas marina]|uniref:Cytochrome c-type biogenesis protein n=1 Tax=Nitrosomonas marina TaxID=917 RepID=A0A1H8I7D5_9PROT|nr:cytochrome c-type biogenesis protein CcmH [Nitrosomonas marina]